MYPGETIDPHPPAARGVATEAVARVELLFHSDLRRVGGQSVLGAASDARPRVIGRDAPLFTSPAGGEALPLLDPCISREQLTVAYDAARGLFEVKPGAGARRPLAFYDARGTEVRGGLVPPGTLVAVGDRALLRLRIGDPPEPAPGPELTGLSAPMEHLRRQLLGLARCDDTVLIHGPTGVGKERAALALHRWGPRSGGRFVAVNCAAIPEPLVESELFGHAKGAFSGAGAARRGLIEEADGGTLFLDEIGDLSLPTQAKLLRVLQDHRLRPVGSSDEIAVDVRIVAATNRELLADLEAGRFRADLYGRLEGFRVEVPALSARREDIPVLLAQFFAARVAASDDAARWVRPANEFAPPIPLAFALGLLAREWPRNVRELERTVASIAVASERARVFTAPADEAPHEPPAAGHARPGAEELRRLLDEHEYVSHRVARALGVSTTTIDRWMREHAIVRPRDLGADALTAALDAADGDPARAARALSVSLRGLKLRLRELGLTREDSR